MKEIVFSHFCNLYEGGAATIVGKGPTKFEYELLSELPAPVVFINEAVQFARHLHPSQDRYLFFLDDHQAEHWFKTEIGETILVAKEEHRRLTCGGADNRCVFYNPILDRLPLTGRRGLSQMNQLLLRGGAGGGTIVPVLHWLWYTGVKKINLVGCDGLNRQSVVHALTGGRDYDGRLEEIKPGSCRWQNHSIKSNQDMLIELFGFTAEYHGTPPSPPPAPVRFVSFGTPDYAPELVRLRESAAPFKLDLYTEFAEDTGDWTRNTGYKPKFLKKLQTVWPEQRLCWVDADAAFRQAPSLLDSLPETVDIAYAMRGEEVLSGTVYLGATDAAKRLVTLWLAEVHKHDGRVPDGKALATVLRAGKYNVQVLPPSYTFIFDISRKEHPGVEPVIEHMQSSRRKRNATMAA
jgi:hypothetical protein